MTEAVATADEDGAEGLATDLSSLLDNAKFYDVTLCVGGKEFRAHRAILAARSPVFAAMFEHDMLEKAEDRVNIEDLDGDVSKLREGAARLREGEVMNDAEILATHLSLLLDNAKFCDVTLCAGGREFRAHRAILAARSPVFAAMLEHDMLEKAEDRVDIEDLDGDVLHQLLLYVYTGITALDTEDEAGSSSSVILSLLAAADKYSLPKLKEACSAHLRSNLTADMALGVLVVADLHGVEDLKEAAVKTVIDNAVHIKKTDDWLAFLKDYPELANCVMLRLAMQHK